MFSNRKIVAIGVVATAVALAGFALLAIPDEQSWGNPANAEAVALGERVYAEQCAECHGKDLGGEADWRVRKADGTLPAPPHDATGHTWHHGDDLLFAYTKGGGAAVAPPGFKSGMPAFGDALSDEEIWAALAYIKSRWPEPVLQRQQAASAQR